MGGLPFLAIGLLAGHALADYPLQGDFLACKAAWLALWSVLQ